MAAERTYKESGNPSDLHPIPSLESLSPSSKHHEDQHPPSQPHKMQHALIIDGAYLQIGLKDLSYPVDSPGHFGALLDLFERIKGHKFD